jgi:hypothetical protein
LACGDKAIHIVNPLQRQEHLHRLTEEGIDPTLPQQSGQLQIRDSTDVYLQDGRFDQDRMIGAFEEMATIPRGAEGFPLSRIVCRMDWMPGDQSRVDDVIEFEARVNDVWGRCDDAVICTYQLANLSGDTVIDIVRTHPMVIIGGHLQQNPFFTPPEQFLREFRDRRLRRTNSK